MEFKQVQELVKQINKSRVTELHFEKDDFKITIKKESKKESKVPAQPVQPIVNPAMPYQMPQAPAQPAAPQAPASQQAAPPAESVSSAQENKKKGNHVEIKSPMIGTFYRSASPDKPAFVNVGDNVSEGQNVCIIEAMKLFNEVESEVSGKIVEILVEDASPVEFDQPLFLVEP
ncbi:MAG TPA: acetyl-CoA carboxylase biotin carboxyl carrier protein [Chitinophagaceae bacterium]|nr:acetyl-CoA carboxylase biotin carboxyl carrier protein [Chitinophagaceae bacterium]